MAGAFGKEAGRVSIRVLPDADSFRRELKAAVEKVEATYRANPPKIRFEADLDTAKMRAQLVALSKRALSIKAVVDVDTAAARAKLKTLDEAIRVRVEVSKADLVAAHRKVSEYFKLHPVSMNVTAKGGVGAVAKESAKMSAAAKATPVTIPVRLESAKGELLKHLGLISASRILNSYTGRLVVFTGLFAAAVPVIIGAGEALGVMSKSLLVLAPALLAAGAGVGVLIYTFKGLTDALDDFEKKDPLRKTAKSVKASIKSITEQSEALQKSIRRRVLPGLANLAGAVSEIAFKPFAKGMIQVAKQVGLAFTDMGTIIQRLPFLRNLTAAFEAVAPVVRSVGQAFAWLITLFAALAAGAGPVLAEWAQATADALGRLAVAAEAAAAAGDIERWAREGGDAVASFWRALVDVGAAIRNIGNLGGVTGAGFLAGFEAAAESMRAFTESAAGAEVISTIMGGISRALENIGRVLGAFGPALSQTFLAVAAGAAPVVEAMTQIAVLIGETASKIAQWEHFVPIVTGLVTAFLTFKTVMFAVKAAALAFQVVMLLIAAINPFTLIIAGISLLVAGLVYAYQNSERARDIMNAAWEAIKNAANIAFTTIKVIITNVLSAIGAVISFYVNFYKSVWNGLQALWSIAKALFARVVSAVLSFANDVKSRFVALVAGALTAWQRLKDLPKVLAGILAAVIGRVASWVGGFVGKIRQAATSAVSALRSGLSNAAGAVSSALGGALSAAAGFVGRFVSVGRNLIMGVARGISSAAGAVASAARNAASRALSAAKGFLGISSPSKVARDQIGREFTRGIAAGIPAEVKAAEDAAVATMRSVVAAAKTQSGQVPLFAGTPGRVDIPKEYFTAATARAQSRTGGDTIINGTFGYDPAEVARELQKRRSRDLAVSLPVGVV